MTKDIDARDGEDGILTGVEQELKPQSAASGRDLLYLHVQ